MENEARMEVKEQSMLRQFLHDWKGKGWFFVNMFFTLMYLIWRIFFTIPFECGLISVISGFSLLIVEALGMVEAFVHYANMYNVKGYPCPDVPFSEYPHVDVFIATYSEDCELLYKTINGCRHMDYPDPSKVHIYLCDDNRRPEMRSLAEKMGIHYLDRPDNKGAKAGNLNNALAHSTSPYIVTFDADMIPKSDFLMKLIPYFVDARIRNRGRKEEEQIRLGFVQSPQAFYNPDLFQFNLFSEKRIPNEQDYFYKDIQVARTRTNSVIYGGSNTVIAREALEAVGGFYTKAITEDFATGILIQKAGYVSLAVGEPLASGLSATDLQGLIQQRIRWGRGVIATGRKMHLFTSRELSFAQKINYWASVWYWYAPLKRLIYMMSPIMYATFGFMVFKCNLIQVLLFWLPMYVSSNISLRMLSRNIRNTKWTSIYENVLFPFMLLPIILETFGISLKKFKVTKKETQLNEKGQNVVYMIPFLILILLSVIGLIRCITIMFDSGSFEPIVVIFWLINNLFLLVMSLFFVDGRVPYRKTERVSVSCPCILSNRMYRMNGMVKDISEDGIAVFMEQPNYFPQGEWLEVEISSERYPIRLSTEIVYVKKEGDLWSYSMKITDYHDTYDQYLQLLYDRVTTLPGEIKRDSGSFEDLKMNTQKRVTPPFFQKRYDARILLDIEVNYEAMEEDGSRKEKKTVHFLDFNFSYAALKGEALPESLVLMPEEPWALQCQYKEDIRKGIRLYRILNDKELWENKEVMEEFTKWLSETEKDASRRERERKNAVREEKRAEKKKGEFDETDLV